MLIKSLILRLSLLQGYLGILTTHFLSTASFRGRENRVQQGCHLHRTHPVTPLELHGAHAGAGGSTDQCTEFVLFSTLLPWLLCPLQGAQGQRVPQQFPCHPSPCCHRTCSHQHQPLQSAAFAHPLPSRQGVSLPYPWQSFQDWLPALCPN